MWFGWFLLICQLNSGQRVVSKDEGEELGKQLGVPFIETSAQNGTNIEEAFMSIAKEIKNASKKTKK